MNQYQTPQKNYVDIDSNELRPNHNGYIYRARDSNGNAYSQNPGQKQILKFNQPKQINKKIPTFTLKNSLQAGRGPIMYSSFDPRFVFSTNIQLNNQVNQLIFQRLRQAYDHLIKPFPMEESAKNEFFKLFSYKITGLLLNTISASKMRNGQVMLPSFGKVNITYNPMISKHFIANENILLYQFLTKEQQKDKDKDKNIDKVIDKEFLFSKPTFKTDDGTVLLFAFLDPGPIQEKSKMIERTKKHAVANAELFNSIVAYPENYKTAKESINLFQNMSKQGNDPELHKQFNRIKVYRNTPITLFDIFYSLSQNSDALSRSFLQKVCFIPYEKIIQFNEYQKSYSPNQVAFLPQNQVPNPSQQQQFPHPPPPQVQPPHMPQPMQPVQQRQMPQMSNQMQNHFSPQMKQMQSPIQMNQKIPPQNSMQMNQMQGQMRPPNQMGNQMQNQMGNQQNQMQNQMPNQMQNQLGNQMQNQMGNQMPNQLGNQMQNQMGNQMQNQMPNQMQNQMSNQMGNQMSNQQISSPQMSPQNTNPFMGFNQGMQQPPNPFNDF